MPDQPHPLRNSRGEFAAPRPAPPELEPEYPKCSMCFKPTWYDGDSFRCDDCEASWSDILSGPGEWDEPNRPACPSAAKVWDTPGKRDHYPDLRNFVYSCCLPDEHDGPHRADRLSLHWETWTDDDPRVVSRG